MGFERIIRPFQLPGYAPPATTPQTPLPASTPVHLEIGKGNASLYTFNGSFSSSESFYMDASVKEQERKTTPHRVFSKDDPSVFVDVDMVDKLTATGNTGVRWQKTKYEFNNEDQQPDTGGGG